MGEGTFLSLLKFLHEYSPDPVTAELARLAHRDEARHVAFGTEHVRYVLQTVPESVARWLLRSNAASRVWLPSLD